jgi:hypothetical protein
MLGYFGGMGFRSGLVFLSFVLSMGLLSGCGDESGTTNSGFTASESQTAGVEVAGNVASGAESQSILVFAFLRSGEEGGDEPVSVGIVDEEGQFMLSGLPSGKIAITFLADGANDGVIDRGDPIANLPDPDHQLDDLQSGDRVHVTDIHLDFRTKRAVADAIEVTHAGDSEAPQSTPTPEG